MPWNWPRSSLHEIQQAGGDPLSLNVLGVQNARDNVELVHVHFYQDTISDPVQMTILHRGKVPVPQHLGERLETLESDGPTSLKQMNDIQKQIGDCTAKAIKKFAKEQHFSLDDDIDLIGATGCLLDERTEDGSETDGSTTSHELMELGDLSIVAASTYKTTVGDFHISAIAAGLPHATLSHSFQGLLEGQADDSGVVDSVKGPLHVAFASFEGCVGRPLSAGDEDDNERTGHVGHVQSGDNFFELRRKVVKFWGECPENLVAPTQQLIVDCEC